jgi:hypothetical protein
MYGADTTEVSFEEWMIFRRNEEVRSEKWELSAPSAFFNLRIAA